MTRGPVLTLALALVVAGCAMLDPRTAVGPCQLDVHTVSDDSVQITLDPPYETKLRARQLIDTVGERDISFTGVGWTKTKVELTGPGIDSMVVVEGEQINGGFQGWVIDQAGRWHFRLTSGSCLREFWIEVGPAPS